MSNLQNEFLSFHEEIKLGTYNENQTLRDKRDMLIKELKKELKGEKIPNTEKALTFTNFDQGSYAMHTGIKPPDDDYDIDVGVVFNIDKDEYGSVKLKKMIRDKLLRENRTIIIRLPCITVNYAAGYHVDLAVYADNSNDYHIAWGKEYSIDPLWEKSEPKKLIEWVGNVSNDAKGREQYRRCVRYLKVWKEKHFPSVGNAKPPSIGLTIQARTGFHFMEASDLEACIMIVNHIRNSFTDEYDIESGTFKKTIKTYLPVAPYNKNVYEKMTLNQTDNYYDKIDTLHEALIAAKDEESLHESSLVLRQVFGDKFPLIEEEEARQSNKKPVITTGNNA